MNGKVIEKLGDVARLDTLVTVVDCANFHNYVGSTKTLIDTYANGEQPVPENDERTIVNLLVDQLEFADVILLNKTDIASPEVVGQVRGACKKLNVCAKVI